MTAPDFEGLLRGMVEAWDAFEAQHDLSCAYARGKGECDCGFAEMERQGYVAGMVLRVHDEAKR